MLVPDDIMRERPDTRHRDYILTDYEPRCDPRGRAHSVSAFRALLRKRGWLQEAWPIVEALREHLGPDETVWGYKTSDAGNSIELYFYNNIANAEDNPKRVSHLVRALEPVLRVDCEVDESLPYFMVSFDLDDDILSRKTLDGMHVYIGSGDRSRMQCGFSYYVRGREFQLENHYWFYNPKRPRQRDDVNHRLACSPHAPSGALARILPEYLTDCHTICYAVKPAHDSIYVSRIDDSQLVRFLDEYWPDTLRDLLRDHPDEFAHLRWDLGYDFCLDPSAPGGARINKVGVYGIF